MNTDNTQLVVKGNGVLADVSRSKKVLMAIPSFCCGFYTSF